MFHRKRIFTPPSNYGGTVTWVSILEEDAATSPSLPATSEWEEASDNYPEFQKRMIHLMKMTL